LAFPTHVGGPKHIHNNAATTFHDFGNQRASVKNKVSTYSKDALIKYKTRLEAYLSVVAYLALQGESFLGHDKTSTSLSKHQLNLLAKLESGQINSGKGKQQETSLTRNNKHR
jgi:hypothetical protein